MTISEKLFQNHNGPKYCVKPVWAKIFRFIVPLIFFAVAAQHFCRNFNFLNSIKIFQSFLILKLFVLGNNIPNVYSVIGRMQAMFNVFNWSRTFLKPEGKKNADFNGFWFPVPWKYFLSIFGQDKRMFAGTVTETPMLSIHIPRKKTKFEVKRAIKRWLEIFEICFYIICDCFNQSVCGNRGETWQ